MKTVIILKLLRIIYKATNQKLGCRKLIRIVIKIKI